MSLRPLLSGALLLLAFSVGCSSLPRPVEPAETFSFAGGTVTGPAAGPWHVYRHEQDGVLFVRGTTDAAHRVLAHAAVLAERFEDLASYRDYLENAVGGNPDFECTAREFEVVEGSGPGYVRGALAFERPERPEGPATRLDNRSRNYLLADGRQVILSLTQTYPLTVAPLDLSAELAEFFGRFELAGPERTAQEP